MATNRIPLRRFATTALLLLVAAVASVSWLIAHPTVERLPIAPSLIAADSQEGEALRLRAEDRADLDALEQVFETQRYATYCGVASSVMALNALGIPASQADFFDARTAAVRSGWATFYMGMPLDKLGGLLVAYGAAATVIHAGDASLEEFRGAARTNLSRAGDVVLVNYDRAGVDQPAGGHISPLGAYDETSDRFLVLDVSAYKYPPVWVKADALYRAMNTTDSSASATRGYVLVGRP